MGKGSIFPTKIMLTESALFFLNLCNDYRDIQNAKVTSGVSEEWLKNKATTAVRRRRLVTEDSDNDATAPEATSSAASKPSKKRITNTGVVVLARDARLSSKQSRRASTLGDSEKVRDKEPTDVQTGSHDGGLDDEDDEEEWEAMRQSPAKERGVRISDHVRCHYVRLLATC